tara:strand:+ start:211 stop:501 length:291 start_codon:yes stop_codon:yes gene_type:complete
LFENKALRIKDGKYKAFSGCSGSDMRRKGSVKIGLGNLGNLLKQAAGLLELILISSGLFLRQKGIRQHAYFAWKFIGYCGFYCGSDHYWAVRSIKC